MRGSCLRARDVCDGDGDGDDDVDLIGLIARFRPRFAEEIVTNRTGTVRWTKGEPIGQAPNFAADSVNSSQQLGLQYEMCQLGCRKETRGREEAPSESSSHFKALCI